MLYRNWWNCRSQRESDLIGVKSYPYEFYQVYLGLYSSIFDVSYAEDIEDIDTDKEQQQKCNYRIGAVPIYMVSIPGIYRFVKTLIFNLPPAVADSHGIF